MKLAGQAVAFLHDSQLAAVVVQARVFDGDSHLIAQALDDQHILWIKSVDLRALHIQGADHLTAHTQGNHQFRTGLWQRSVGQEMRMLLHIVDQHGLVPLRRFAVKTAPSDLQSMKLQTFLAAAGA